MPLMPKSQREQMLVAVALIAVLAAGAYWYFLFAPKATELGDQRTRLEKLVSENQKARTEMAKGNIDQIRNQLADYGANLELLRTLVPTSNEVPALLEQVSTAARREGLELASVDPQPVIEGDPYDTYRYDVGVVGSYHQLGAFLSNVGSLQRIVAPVNVKLTPRATPGNAPKQQRSGEPTTVEARFQIQTFVARGVSHDEDAAMPIHSSRGK